MSYREDGALLDAYAGLYNLSTGAGTRRDKNLNFEVNLQASTISREECSSLFKTSGLVQKIVALLPEESPVEWYSINLGKDTTAPQDITNYLEDKLNLHEKLVEASVLARLHRNAYIVIFANDGKSADQPLDEENLQEITELKVLSSYELRPSIWSLELGGHSLIEPEYYDLIGLWELNKRLKDEQKIPLNQMRIHKSRVLKFAGRKLYGWMLHENHGEDLSVLQSILVAFGSYMQGVMASSGMIQDYSVFTYKLKGLAELILKGQSDAIIRRFLAIQMGMSYNKGLAMDAETEEAGFVQRNYGGVGDIVDRLKALLTAESGIPHTKLWGEGSQGNTSGQSEKYDYADALESFQRHNWLKPTKEIARLCLLSQNGVTKGKIPKGWRLSTRSSLRLDLEAEAKLRQTQARTDQVYRMMGSLHPLEIRKNRFGSPDYSMETVLDPEIDKALWKVKDSPEFMLPVLAGKPTGSGTGTGENQGKVQTGTDVGSRAGQTAIAGAGGDGGNNAEMLAQESDRERMAENRRTDEKTFRYDGSAVRKRLKWGDRILAIEYLPGDIRHNLPMQGIYGYIQKHTGHDNEPLDFYATTDFFELLNSGEQPKGKIFEIYQLKANAEDPLERKSLDETKVILGCDSLQEAVDLYLAHMPEEFLGLVNDLTPEELRHYRYRRDENMDNFLNIASFLLNSDFREDAQKKQSKPVDSGSSSKKKPGYDPSQQRGKDGRWVETGAEARRVSKKESNTTESNSKKELTIETDPKQIAKMSKEWTKTYDLMDQVSKLDEKDAAVADMEKSIDTAKKRGQPNIILKNGSGLSDKKDIEANRKANEGKVEIYTDISPADGAILHKVSGGKILAITTKNDSEYTTDISKITGYDKKITLPTEDRAKAFAKEAVQEYVDRHVLSVPFAETHKSKLQKENDKLKKSLDKVGLTSDMKDVYKDNMLVGHEIIAAAKQKNKNMVAMVDSNGKMQAAAFYKEEKSALYVEYLATAPWNLSTKDPRLTRGAAAKTLATISQTSVDLGKRGKIELTSLPRAESFYEKMGFVKGLEMSLSEKRAKELREKYGQ